MRFDCLHGGLKMLTFESGVQSAAFYDQQKMNLFVCNVIKCLVIVCSQYIMY